METWRLVQRALVIFRQCLKNLLGRPFYIKPTHLAYVHSTKAATKLPCKITSQLFDQFLAILGSCNAILLKFDDPAADLPICGRHESVDTTNRGYASGLQ
jgi:hypothetical protein